MSCVKTTFDITENNSSIKFSNALFTIDGERPEEECYTIVMASPTCVINTHLADFYISHETYETLIQKADTNLSRMGGYFPGEVPEWAKLKYILRHFNWCLP